MKLIDVFRQINTMQCINGNSISPVNSCLVIAAWYHKTRGAVPVHGLVAWNPCTWLAAVTSGLSCACLPLELGPYQISKPLWYYTKYQSVCVLTANQHWDSPDVTDVLIAQKWWKMANESDMAIKTTAAVCEYHSTVQQLYTPWDYDNTDTASLSFPMFLDLPQLTLCRNVHYNNDKTKQNKTKKPSFWRYWLKLTAVCPGYVTCSCAA